MTNDRPTDPDAVAAALAAPFPADQIKYLPKTVKGNRALAMPYIDARLVQERLDDVLGVANWQDAYEVTGHGDAICTLRLRIAGEWVAKSDTGAYAENLAGEGLKAAFSDALKRTAVKFGVGRYLYRLPAMWADYDPVRKIITNPPQLPPWALPKGCQPAAPPAATVSQIDQATRAKFLPQLERAAAEGSKSLDAEWRAVGQAARTACQLDLDKLKDFAAGADLFAKWRDWLDNDPPLSKINENVPRIEGIKNAVAREKVMQMVREHCQSAGAEWDERGRHFAQTFGG